MITPEERVRQQIDRLLTAAGWAVQGAKQADPHAARAVTLRRRYSAVTSRHHDARLVTTNP